MYARMIISIGKIEPEQYIITSPNVYNHRSYNVTHSTGNCVQSITIITISGTHNINLSTWRATVGWNYRSQLGGWCD